jgi:hypothetical protein
MNQIQDDFNNKQNQFEFEIIIKSIEIEYSSSFNFKILIKKGTKTMEMKNPFKYEVGERRVLEINENFNLNTSLFLNKDETSNDLKGEVNTQVYTKQGFKSATYTELNLAEQVDLKTFSAVSNHLNLDFKKHPFNYLKINLLVSSKRLFENEENGKELENKNSQSNDISYKNASTSSIINSRSLYNKSNASLIESNSNRTYTQSITNEKNSSNIENKIKNDSNTNNPNSVITSSIKNPNENPSSTNNTDDVFLLNENLKVLSKKNESLEIENRNLIEKISLLENSLKSLQNEKNDVRSSFTTNNVSYIFILTLDE